MNGTVNKVILGYDVKMHYFEDHNSIGYSLLSTSEIHYNHEKNEWVNHTEWHQIVVRNRLAEICEKHLEKCDKIYVKWTFVLENGITMTICGM
ncbi:MAG: single-stranded DNA-binding protein [Flavobacteriales bacterium AspAUS03]